MAALSSAASLKAKVVGPTEDNKRKLLTAQMREKAMARQAANAASSVPASNQSTATLDQNKSNCAARIAKEPNHSSAAPSPCVASNTHPVMSSLKPKTPNSIKDQEKQASQSQIMSPMDTYEISDREDSDSDSESESESEDETGSTRKKVSSV